jgi:hypothetical protein
MTASVEWEYGLFNWRGDSDYRKANAIKLYKSKAQAEKAASKYKLDDNIVVRQVYR